MFEGIMKIFRRIGKKEQEEINSKDTAKERLHLVLMQDRANVSADFLELMKQEIIDVIKKYIDVDDDDIDVRLTNKTNEDGTTGAPALYANIPIAGIKQVKEEEHSDKKEPSTIKLDNDNNVDKKEKKIVETILSNKNENNQKKEDDDGIKNTDNIDENEKNLNTKIGSANGIATENEKSIKKNNNANDIVADDNKLEEDNLNENVANTNNTEEKNEFKQENTKNTKKSTVNCVSKEKDNTKESSAQQNEESDIKETAGVSEEN